MTRKRLSERLAMNSPWREACERRIESADGWDMSHRENRAELRHWKRRLFWAKYGVYRAAIVGALIGGIPGVMIGYNILDAIGVSK